MLIKKLILYYNIFLIYFIFIFFVEYEIVSDMFKIFKCEDEMVIRFGKDGFL